MSIALMGEADDHAAARLAEKLDLFWSKVEMDELDGRGLPVRGGAIHIFFRLAQDPMIPQFHKSRLLYSTEAGQEGCAAHWIIDFEHHRRAELLPLRHQRIVGRQLVRDLLFPAAFDVEHLVDLGPHRVVVFKVEGANGPNLQATMALLLHKLLSQRLAFLFVALHGPDVFAGYFGFPGHSGLPRSCHSISPQARAKSSIG